MMLTRRQILLWSELLCCGFLFGLARLTAAESGGTANAPVTVASHAAPRFDVRAYAVEGRPALSTNLLESLFAGRTGTNLDLADIAKAAMALQAEYRDEGYPGMSVAIRQERITNGIVTMHVFRAALPQIVVSGERYSIPANLQVNTANPAAARIPPQQPSEQTGAVAGGRPAPATNATPAEVTQATPAVASGPPPPASPEEMARLNAALLRRLADTRVHVVSTNAGPRFDVEHYVISGNSLLPPEAVARAITNIDGAFGTNVSFDGIKTAVTELGKAYRERGYGLTVSVVVPQQQLTNATVKLKVIESRLAAINISGNRYFSSNNVKRALPSLHTNRVLNSPIFNAELNRANANQDRQIYPVIAPGPKPGTSILMLTVKDRLPLHAKLELNNQSSPGTPDLRVNASAAYNNLWQREQSLGVQYGFSPEVYKPGDQWNFYDRPQVAYYSAFYRFPLGSPEAIENLVASRPLSFGYSEATRQFRLPPPSGRPELSMYASRSTVDTGIQSLVNKVIFDVPGVRRVTRQDVQDDVTINQTLGFRLSAPLRAKNGVRSVLSGGVDFKTYSLVDNKTNMFSFLEITRDPNGNLNPPIVSSVSSPSPIAHRSLNYAPVSLRYDLSGPDLLGPASFGVGLSVNTWYSGSTTYSNSSTNGPAALHGQANLQGITGSRDSTGHWVILDSSVSQEFTVHPGWPLTFRLKGQWASEPLISTEQFGVGGVASVRGYHEGEVFGDTGFYASLEQRTPEAILGTVYGHEPLGVSGSLCTGFGEAILLDPQTRPQHVGLWGIGAGTALTIGPHWQARLLFSMPMLSTPYTRAYQPFFNFALDAQF